LANKAKTLTFDEILLLPTVEKDRLGLKHTPGEINQQSATWLETFGILKGIQPELKQFLETCGLDASGRDRLCVSLIGAGTSDYIGRAIESLLRKEWRCQVQAAPSTSLLTEMDEFLESAPEGTGHLWVSFSRSGDSFEGVKVIEKALDKYPHINHLIITCNSGGRMADLANGPSNIFCVVLDDAVNDRGLAMTSSFTNMVIAGHCLAHIADLDSYKPVVETLAAAAARTLPKAAELASKIAEKDHSRICFLGSGPLKAAGDESSLKVMELTAGYYSVMSESFLGLRHGPLAWLNCDSLVIGFLSNSDEKRNVELGLLDELRGKNAVADILVITPQSSIAIESADYVLELDIAEEIHDNYRPPIDVLFAQCLGLFASLRRNLKPDAPSADGKIQRVVSQINLKGLNHFN